MQAGVSEFAMRLAGHFWPGALTLVAGRAAGLPEILSPLPTIGVRMPNHAWALALLQRVGPLATTSANLSGAANPLSAEDVLAQLDGRVDLVIDGGPSPLGLPSTVVDCTGLEPKILRQGAITADEILSVI
jgi:L-threonylcarbamoyladenylate synthase